MWAENFMRFLIPMIGLNHKMCLIFKKMKSERDYSLSLQTRNNCFSMKKYILIIIIFLGSISVNAYDFEYQGLYYVVTSVAELSVNLCPPPDGVNYPNNLVIPSTVKYNGKTLYVRGFVYNAIPSNIVSITIPNTISFVNNNLFDECTLLRTVTFEDGVDDIKIGHGPEYRDKDGYGVYRTFYKGLFFNCPLTSAYLGRNIVLTYSLEYDKNYSTFERVSTLESIVMGDYFKKVVKRLFYKCDNLKTVHLSSNLQTIDLYAFASCQSLESIEFPASLTSIGTFAFGGCERITQVSIPSNVGYIYHGAFAGCNSLNKIVFLGKTGLEDYAFGSDSEPSADVYVYSEEPANIKINSFSHNTFLRNLYVPKGTKELYANTIGWNNFWNIIELDNTIILIGDVNNDGEINIADINAIINVILCDIGNQWADVNNDGEVNIADVNMVIGIILGDTPSTPSTSQTFTVNGVTFKMVTIEGGSFTMGATSEQGNDAYNWENPAHKVNITSFRIGQTEVTQELWLAVMGNNPSGAFSGDLNRPVGGVSWSDCQVFIQKLNELTGKTFRLPTEAEWEFAARGGNKSNGYKYSGSNSINEVAWWGFGSDGNSGYGTNPVATKKPNELGLYDMSGNVFEWCEDWYGSYSSLEQTDPRGPDSGNNRTYRGGSWIDLATYCRVSCRSNDSPTRRYHGLGLRLAM